LRDFPYSKHGFTIFIAFDALAAGAPTGLTRLNETAVKTD